jgi:hypothetical protein
MRKSKGGPATETAPPLIGSGKGDLASLPDVLLAPSDHSSPPVLIALSPCEGSLLPTVICFANQTRSERRSAAALALPRSWTFSSSQSPSARRSPRFELPDAAAAHGTPLRRDSNAGAVTAVAAAKGGPPCRAVTLRNRPHRASQALGFLFEARMHLRAGDRFETKGLNVGHAQISLRPDEEKTARIGLFPPSPADSSQRPPECELRVILRPRVGLADLYPTSRR